MLHILDPEYCLNLGKLCLKFAPLAWLVHCERHWLVVSIEQRKQQPIHGFTVANPLPPFQFRKPSL